MNDSCDESDHLYGKVTSSFLGFRERIAHAEYNTAMH